MQRHPTPDAPASLSPDSGRRRESRNQLARFLVVGTTCVLVDLAVYRLLVLMSCAVDLAKGLSYFTGVIVGFCGNKWWTFKSDSRSATEPIWYLSLSAVTLAINIACNRGALAALGDKANLWAFLFATGVTTVLNFLGMKFITFRRGVEQRREQAIKRAA